MNLSSPPTFTSFDAARFEQLLRLHSRTTVGHFKRLSRKYALFHILFATVAAVELFCFLLFLPFFSQSSVLSFTLASFFLTFFSYFVLRFYLAAKKPEDFNKLKKDFIDMLLTTLPENHRTDEKNLSLIRGIFQLVDELQTQDQSFYPLFLSFPALRSLLEKFSVWCHWKDLHTFKEMLLLDAIKLQLRFVKNAPTDPEGHMALANGFLALSKLYLDPRKRELENLPPFIPSEYSTDEMQAKFKRASEKAIQELEILEDYCPGDPWVHACLAGVYRDLKLTKEEIKEYEILLSLSPEDSLVLYRLGRLYFQEGENGKGLKVYEKLQRSDASLANELIAHYETL